MLRFNKSFDVEKRGWNGHDWQRRLTNGSSSGCTSYHYSIATAGTLAPDEQDGSADVPDILASFRNFCQTANHSARCITCKHAFLISYFLENCSTVPPVVRSSAHNLWFKCFVWIWSRDAAIKISQTAAKPDLGQRQVMISDWLSQCQQPPLFPPWHPLLLSSLCSAAVPGYSFLSLLALPDTQPLTPSSAPTFLSPSLPSPLGFLRSMREELPLQLLSRNRTGFHCGNTAT